jgi:hypothetical protein
MIAGNGGGLCLNTSRFRNTQPLTSDEEQQQQQNCQNCPPHQRYCEECCRSTATSSGLERPLSSSSSPSVAKTERGSMCCFVILIHYVPLLRPHFLKLYLLSFGPIIHHILPEWPEDVSFLDSTNRCTGHALACSVEDGKPGFWCCDPREEHQQSLGIYYYSSFQPTKCVLEHDEDRQSFAIQGRLYNFNFTWYCPPSVRR